MTETNESEDSAKIKVGFTESLSLDRVQVLHSRMIDRKLAELRILGESSKSYPTSMKDSCRALGGSLSRLILFDFTML